MINDQHLLDAWYHYAAHKPGFIGATLKAQREKAFMTQEQQRNLLGILHEQYDHTWLRLQAMHLPRQEHFRSDLERMRTKVMDDPERNNPLNLIHLEELILAGLQ